MSKISIPGVRPDDFVLIPGTESWVSIQKTRNYRGKVITGLSGYDEVRMAQSLGFYPTSSAEWGQSRQYFQDHPEENFQGRTGKDIEQEYISDQVERTATLLAFAKNREFPVDVHDLLKEAGFDGKIALIDHPYVQEDEDVFISSPRTRVVDVSDKVPLESNYGQEYDPELGIFTKVGPEANQEFHGAHQWVTPEGTRQLLRGYWGWHHPGGRRFRVDADWGPADSDSDVASRLSSGNDPSFLDPEKTKIQAAGQEVLASLEEVSEKYGLEPADVIEALRNK